MALVGGGGLLKTVPLLGGAGHGILLCPEVLCLRLVFVEEVLAVGHGVLDLEVGRSELFLEVVLALGRSTDGGAHPLRLELGLPEVVVVWVLVAVRDLHLTLV